MFSIYELLIEKLKCVQRSVVATRRKRRVPGGMAARSKRAVYTQTSAHPDGTSSGPFSGPKRKNVTECFNRELGEVKPV